ncbi:hypothetical protein O181_026094 [Austropuccinia psidii MF-1]|uniref:Uncharacterized protein n=1 Tax=Austropuccinia psidii MF-1 TaxID=1389203 RepID=A0A9Q3CLS1_9BASI|nr:hypothetical protein [Austropuccinia psidii MF-1]
MTHTLTYHSIQNVKLCHHNIGRGIGPYAPAPTPAHAHAQAPAHANAAAPHPWYCAAGSTSVTCKMSIPLRWNPFMDDLGSHTPLLYIKTG